MENRIEITNDEIQMMAKRIYGTNSLGECGDDFLWYGDRSIAVKKVISFRDMMRLVRTVADSCFDDDGEYMPEVKDFCYQSLMVEYYSNVKLPEDIEERNELIYGTNLSDMIIARVSNVQHWAIEAAIEERINHRKNVNMRKVEQDAEYIVGEMSRLYEGVEKMLDAVDPDELKNLLSNAANMDKADIAQAIMDSERKRSETLKVVK